MTLEQLRVFKILVNHTRKHKIVSTIDDRELLRRVAWNEGLERVLVDLTDFLSGDIDAKYIDRVLELEGNSGS